ncbi:MAG TPA: KH domain-containing protein [Patescibacteria group bacterium]|nr:KH domain-containing protein [Patescibacteria group bacterium]
MKDLLSYLLKNLTGVETFEVVEETSDDGFIKLTAKLPKELIGLVIGKEGKTINAIRAILRSKATLDKKGFTLEVQEKE